MLSLFPRAFPVSVAFLPFLLRFFLLSASLGAWAWKPGPGPGPKLSAAATNTYLPPDPAPPLLQLILLLPTPTSHAHRLHPLTQLLKLGRVEQISFQNREERG